MASSSDPTKIGVTMLLCDAAQSVGGKLYVLGGGWSQISVQAPGVMALALNVAVPWGMANEKLTLTVALLTDEGEPVMVGGNPVQAENELEVGRPPGLKKGIPLDANLALNFQGIELSEGGYVWELRVVDTVLARSPFQVRA